MSVKSENLGKGTAYFSDGHTEAITDFEISKDGHDVWFTVESGRWFIYREELVYHERPSAEQELLDKMHILMSGSYYPEYKFYKIQRNIECGDLFELECNIITQYLVTNEIKKIRICVVD